MRWLRTLILCSLGCASGSQRGSETPTAEDDPCAEPTGFAVVLDAFNSSAQSARSARCVEHQHVQAQAEARRQHEEQVRAQAQAEAAARAPYAKQRAQLQHYRENAAAIDAEIEAEEQRHAEQSEYWTTVEIRECAAEWSADRARYQLLALYQQAPERDKAIAFLEGCRKAYARSIRRVGPKAIANVRRDFALDLEDAFDDANPYRKGWLIARVDGSLLRVSMRGGFEGRARHSQGELDSWCEIKGADVFSKIVLKNKHGAFSCVPATWPGSTKAYIDNALQGAGAAAPLSTAPGKKPVPLPIDSEGEPEAQADEATPQPRAESVQDPF